MISVFRTHYEDLQDQIRNIGWENILQIIPEHIYDGTVFVIIYRSNSE